MNPAEIKKLAEAIFENTFIDDWYFYLIFLTLVFLGSFLASYIKGYGSEKAKYSAIESSLKTIEKKVALTTEISEKIKNDIELQVWKEKERQSIKRAKLEEYLTTIYLVNDNTHLEMENKLFDAKHIYNEQAWNKADMLRKLYLPELKVEHNQFRLAYIEYRKWLINGIKEKQSEPKQDGVTSIPSGGHMDIYGEIRGNFNPALLAIDKKVGELADKLLM